MDPDVGNDPLLEDDEVLDYLLYKEMENETGRRSGAGCLGGVFLFAVIPAGLILLNNLL